MPKVENEDKNETQSTDSRVYELGYLLTPSISEENLPITYGNLRELVMSFKGEIISDEMPKMIPLAYVMSKIIANTRYKFNTAHFGWIKFIMDSENVPELKKKVDLDQNLIRFLILKIVKENTIAAKRFVRGEMHRKPRIEKSGENETVAPINKEEIDKEIDALISV
jgi:ribosomal protein S6